MNLPSEALNRKFVLDEEPVTEQLQPEQQFRVITTHGVQVGNIGLLMPSNQVSELVDDLPICRLPNTPGWFNGVASVRGNMIPVFDMHELIGVRSNSNRRKIIVIGTGETAIAFWIDEMPRMVMVTSDDIMSSTPPLPQLLKDHSRGYYFKNDQTWIEWDIEKFFSNVGSHLL